MSFFSESAVKVTFCWGSGFIGSWESTNPGAIELGGAVLVLEDDVVVFAVDVVVEVVVVEVVVLEVEVVVEVVVFSIVSL